MPKKHKAKGNQQKPQKRRSFRNESLRAASSGSSTPFFSMRDEVLNTERHHSEWSPSIKLRHQGIAFVSGGSIQPLEEPQTVDESQNSQTPAKSLQTHPLQESTTADETQRVNVALDANNEKLADMQIQDPIVGVARHVMLADKALSDFDSADLLSRALAEQDSDGDVPASALFVVDRIGDASLKPKNLPQAVLTSSPKYTDGSDEDEVIVFRGRREQVHTREDNIVTKPVSDSIDARTSVVEDIFKKQPEPDHVPATAAASVLSEAFQIAGLNSAASQKVANALESTTIPTRNVKGGGLAAKMKKKEEKRDRRRAKASRRKARNASLLLEDLAADGISDGEIDDEMVADYLANISGAEELVPGMKSKVVDSDEWESSDMTGEESGAVELAATEEEDDEEDDEDDDDDNTDDGEDSSSERGSESELESELEYNMREQWQDEDDLRQRQIDALTDEEIARILAKQEDLGMGSEEILLLDDSGFGDLSRAQAGIDAILADPSHPNRRKARAKRGKKRSDHFPSASLMADVIEQDPYGGFDVMDFDRPSLRNNTKGGKGRRSAGPLPEELLDDMSDVEFVSELQAAWSEDRAKKASKKREREALRAQGLLGGGGGGNKKKGNKFKADLAARYTEGMSLMHLRAELESFILDEESASKAFPPMGKRDRKLLHDVAHVFDLTSVSRGSGPGRFTVMAKRATRTPDVFEEERWERVLRIVKTGKGGLGTNPKGRSGISASAGRAGRGGGFSKAAVGYANGEVVGGSAPEIGKENFGRRLMEKMGWEKGMALGKEPGSDGLLVPVLARVKAGRGGLG